MSKKIVILPIFLILIITTLATVLFLSTKKHSKNTPDSSIVITSSIPSPNQVKDEILKNALNLYIAKKQEGIDFSNGPCLGIVAPDWVLDIAHSPRQPEDDKPENQCADFSKGHAHHFIELDPSGKLIQIF